MPTPEEDHARKRRDDLQHQIATAMTTKELDALSPLIRAAPFPFNQELGEFAAERADYLRIIKK